MTAAILLATLLGAGLGGGGAGWYFHRRHRRLCREQQQRTEAALRRQLDEVFAVFRAINGGVYVADMETHEILALTGRDRGSFDATVVGSKCFEQAGANLGGPCLFCTNRILLDDNGRPAPPVVREFRNPWSNAWYLAIGRAIHWFDGRLVRMEIAINITERKRAEEALRCSEQNFRELVENSLVGIMLIQNGEIVFQNPEQQRLLGRLPSSFNLEDFTAVHPEDRDKVRESYRKISNGLSPQVDLDFRLYTGGRRDEAGLAWVYCRARPMDFQGRKTILISMMEITRIKELERLLRQQDRMSSLGRVAAGIAHEIRNPLSGINISLTTLRQIYHSPQHRDQVEDIFRRLATASAKIEAVVKRVMDFSKPGQLHPRSVSLNEPVAEALELAGVFLSKYQINLEVDLAPALPLCRVDPGQLEQVVLNLLTNSAEAMEAMPREAPRRLKIATRALADGVELLVDDSGPGLAPEVQGEIMDPFFTTKPEGTGIGLNISQRIINDHGGTIEPCVGTLGGACFRIFLPAAGRERGNSLPGK
ncbi:sensor histidine kinase [Desulfurivibrio alkaliphilus]|uniref:histidine kinase n=1 Tax=Desulfurivibrio alkaliphilus (strain DSM 19089 / UNIQEM U267 / AHT2) TaxID=589865 RepID=D6Z6I6_DESAT|nr:ATP-binding protein [Desulfurivibrio alkaliphilus]ADH84945.1 PAS/PAC sensor signal transduction histidine kinase [Desulfurivibrio alkaliphilus AHT 2]